MKVMAKKKGKQKQETTMRENGGKLLLDFGKLIFGSFILGGVLRGEIPQLVIVISGVVGTAICVIFGLLLINKQKDKE